MPTLVERIEVLRQIKQLQGYFTPEIQQEVIEVSRLVGKPVKQPNCQYCLIEAILYLKKINLELMAKTTAKIKDGQFIMIPFTSDSYTNDNLTDAIARRLLKEYPALAESFKKLPPDEPVEGDEDFADPDALQKQEEELKQQQSLQAENEQLKKELEALRSAGIKPAAPQPLPESANAPKTPAAPVQKDIPPVKDAK